MPNYCNLELSGHLGRDPEGRYSINGKLMLSFSVAFSSGKKDDPHKKPPTWFNCKAVGSAAEALQECVKGDAVVIKKCIPETWKDKNGNDRITWVVFEAEKWEKKESGGYNNTDGEPDDAIYPDDDIPY